MPFSGCSQPDNICFTFVNDHLYNYLYLQTLVLKNQSALCSEPDSGFSKGEHKEIKYLFEKKLYNTAEEMFTVWDPNIFRETYTIYVEGGGSLEVNNGSLKL